MFRMHQTALSVILRTCLMIFVIHRFSAHVDRFLVEFLLSIEAKFMSGEKKNTRRKFQQQRR